MGVTSHPSHPLDPPLESFAIRLFLICSFTALRDRYSLYERVRSKDTVGRGRASYVDHSCEQSDIGLHSTRVLYKEARNWFTS